MAIVSTKGVYGLTAMVVLAKEFDQNLLQIKDIAAKGDIPQNYLEQILVILKKDGFVESIRGANGGYRLAKNSKDINVYAILHTLDCCVSFTDSKTQNNMLTPFWRDIEEKMAALFALNLDELIEFLDNQKENIIYYI